MANSSFVSAVMVAFDGYRASNGGSAHFESYNMSQLKDIISSSRDTEYKSSPENAKFLTREEIERNLSDLEVFCNNNTEGYASIKFDDSDNSIVATTHPIVLEGVLLNTFEVRLQVYQSYLWQQGKFSEAIQVRAITPVRNDYPHPHVDRSRLCWGNAAHIGKVGMIRGDLFHVFQIVLGILNTYNPESPYATIQSYLPATCDECYTRCEDRAMSRCRTCMTKHCTECLMFHCASCQNKCCRDCARVSYWNESRTRRFDPNNYGVIYCVNCSHKHSSYFTAGGQTYKVSYANSNTRDSFLRGRNTSFKNFIKTRTVEPFQFSKTNDGLEYVDMSLMTLSEYYEFTTRGIGT